MSIFVFKDYNNFIERISFGDITKGYLLLLFDFLLELNFVLRLFI